MVGKAIVETGVRRARQSTSLRLSPRLDEPFFRPLILGPEQKPDLSVLGKHVRADDAAGPLGSTAIFKLLETDDAGKHVTPQTQVRSRQGFGSLQPSVRVPPGP